MFELELNEDGLVWGEVASEALLYFASGNYHKNVCYLIGVLIYISEYPRKKQMLDILIIFVKKLNFFKTSSQSVFKKYIWDHFTLHGGVL